MVWPLYIASAVALLSQMLPQPPKTTTPPSATSNNNSLFYSGLLSGLSLGYILTTELQRRRIWDYWRMLWRKRVLDNVDSEPSTTLLEGGISIQHLVRPQTNRTAQLHVEILTIPPKQRITGTSAGVECYLVLKGTLHVNGVIIFSNNVSSSSTAVLEPFVPRTLLNPSSTLSAIVWRATEGAPKENAIADQQSTMMRLSNYLQSSSLSDLDDQSTMTRLFNYLRSSSL